MEVATKDRAAEPVNPDVESYCWHENGWECAAEGSVRDARKVTRGKAAAYYASEVACGHLPSVRVWKRYVRPWTRQGAWDEEWVEDTLIHLADLAKTVADALVLASALSPESNPEGQR